MYKVNSTIFPLGSRLMLILFLMILIPENLLLSQQSTGNLVEYRKGFVLMNNGYSIMGIIKGVYKDQYSNFIWFKALDGTAKEYRRITPYDISSLGNRKGSSRYTSAAIPLSGESDLIFVRLLLEGEYDLLFYDLAKKDHLVIRDSYNRIYDVSYQSFKDTEGSTNAKLSPDEFQGLLQNVFGNNNELQYLISNTRPTKRSLVNLISDYHRISGKTFTTFGIRKFGLAAGLTAGITGDMYYIKANNQAVKSSYTVSPYGGLNIFLYSKNNSLGLIAESSLSKKSFHYNYSVENSDLTSYYETFLETLYLNNRLGLTFSDKKKNKLDPFFEIGGSASFFISPEYENYSDILNNDNSIVTSGMNTDELHSDTYFGLYLRPGANLRINADNVLKFAVEYSVSLGMNEEKLSTAGFSVIYQFKLK